MLTNVKNFVISKNEAFKVGYDPSIMSNVIWCTVKRCVVCTAVAILRAVIRVTIMAIKDGEFKTLVKETTERCKRLNW